MNKKAVEALPLKYIIIALVAALVVGIVLSMVSTLKAGTLSSAEKLNQTLAEKTAMELDETGPFISKVEMYKNDTLLGTSDKNNDASISIYEGNTINFKLYASDEGSGIDPETGVWMNLINKDTNTSVYSYYFTEENDGVYTASYTFSEKGSWIAYFHAEDKKGNAEQLQLIANIEVS